MLHFKPNVWTCTYYSLHLKIIGSFSLLLIKACLTLIKFVGNILTYKSSKCNSKFESLDIFFYFHVNLFQAREALFSTNKSTVKSKKIKFSEIMCFSIVHWSWILVRMDTNTIIYVEPSLDSWGHDDGSVGAASNQTVICAAATDDEHDELLAPLAKENTQAVGRSVRAWLLVVLDGSPHRSRRSLSSIQRWIGDKTGATRDNFHANDNKNELVAISEHKNDQVRGAHALCALL